MNEQLILAAAELSSAAPAAWMKFVEAMRAHADGRRENLVSAGHDHIFILQGTAREARDLQKMFEDCRRQAEAIALKRKGKP